jgi:hypothetical protein
MDSVGTIRFTVGFCEDENLKWRKSMEVFHQVYALHVQFTLSYSEPLIQVQ